MPLFQYYSLPDVREDPSGDGHLHDLAGDDGGPEMNAPREALMKRLEEVASAAWLALLQEKA